MKILNWLLIILSLFFSSKSEGQWCCLDSTLQIVDESTVSLRILISGALNNNLASSGQGVCGVKIKFEHKFIGDLTIDLISPSGQRVRLIGPIGNSGNSDFSKWFVSFVTCKDTAVPDAGFKRIWDNIQSWGILGKFYSGTYYPQAGCLENFNLGTVNGTWTLSISDDQKFYDGKIESFCLLFCNQEGINCKDCSPNGGLFSNTSLDYCQGDIGLSNIDKVSFPVFVPDTTYSYKYIISQNDQILEIKVNPDLSMYPLGGYLICGVSYLSSDSSKLPIVGEKLSDFKNSLVLSLNGFCAELSKNCMSISIHPIFTGTPENIFLCQGDSIKIGNQFYKQTGIYNVPMKSIYGCDSNAIINLEIIDIKIISSSIDSLDCQKKLINIDLSASIKTINTIINWSTSNGNFSDLSDLLNPVIDKEGDYKVVFIDGNCIDSAEFRVYKKDDIPELRITSDTITCLKKVVNIIASSNIFNPDFKWSDGSIDLGTDSILLISTPGRYYITVTDDNGCSNFGDVLVQSDTIPAQLILNAGQITCRDSIAFLSFIADQEIINLNWSGPGQFMNNQIRPPVRQAGKYQLTVQSKNGCISFDTIELNSTKRIPDFFFQTDTLNCRNNLMFILKASTTSILDSVTYSGPSRFSSHDLMPLITESGTYQVKLLDTAGCVLDTFLKILIDTSTSRFILKSSLLDCSNDSVQLLINYTFGDTMNSILWNGPTPFTSNLSRPYAKEAGLYTITVTSKNGCTVQDTITVLQDSQKPDIILNADQLNCNLTEVIIDATVQNILSYQWTGPNGFMSNLEDPLVQDSGLYKLIVLAFNGCTSEKSIKVNADKQSPIKLVSGRDFGCDSDSVQLKLIQNGLLDTIHWKGPGNFTSKLDSFYIKIAGNYTVYARGINGCIDSSSIDVGYDTSYPTFTFKADTLSCNKLLVDIIIGTQDSLELFLWITPTADTLLSRNISVSIPGWYIFKASTLNGCIAIDSVEIIDKRSNPLFQFIGDSITCADSIAVLSIVSNEMNLKYQWSGPGIFNAFDSTIQTILSGWYYYSVSNSFDCTIQDSFLVNAYLQKPRVLFSNPTINCLTKTNPILTATLIDSLDLFGWILPSGLTDLSRSITLNQEGLYIFRGQDAYGCSSDTSLMIVFDTISPSINLIFLDSISCINNQVVPLVETIPPGMMHCWISPSNDTSKLPNPVLTLPGNYLLRITSANFCYIDTVLNLIADTMPPRIQVQGGNITCDKDSVKLNVQSLDSLPSVFWEGPKSIIYSERSPIVGDTGWYKIIVIGTNGCLRIDSTYVGLSILPPVINARGISIPCNPDSAQIMVFSSDTTASINWSGPNRFASNLKNPFVRDTGIYFLMVRDSNNCIATDSVRVIYNRKTPLIQAEGDVLSCKKTMVQFKLVLDSMTKKFIWSGPGLLDSTTLHPIVNTPGFYNIKIQDSLGCTKDTTIEIKIDTIKPSIQIIALDSLICDQKNVRLYNFFSCFNCNYNWSTTNGMIESNQFKDTVIVKGAGTYLLQVEDNTNGCILTEIYNLIEITSSLHKPALQIVDPSCYGLNDGQILFDSIIGGVPPFQISLDGGKFVDITDLNSIAPGNYSLRVKDKYGCIYDTLINIVAPFPLVLSLGRDTTIRLGQSFQIFPSTNANTSFLQNISWSPSTDLNCSTCFNVVSNPRSTTRYVLSIIDENGCIAEDDIVINIIQKPSIFLPNAFSPNQDQVNDFFTIIAGEDIVFIQAFQVFDRWGNMVFSKEDFEVSNRMDLWDGTFKGRPLNPGVFVYKLEAKLLNGKNYKQAGDITLLR